MYRPIVEQVEEVEESDKQLLMLFRLSLRLRPGRSIFDQVVYVAKKALRSGVFQRGQLFPSVRALATELKIHRNTAHKVVKHLREGGWLKTRPRIGIEVATLPDSRAGDRLKQEIEQLIVAAQRGGLDLAEMVHAVEAQWAKIGNRFCNHRGIFPATVGNGPFRYLPETTGFAFPLVSVNCPKSDYESAALTAVLRARSLVRPIACAPDRLCARSLARLIHC